MIQTETSFAMAMRDYFGMKPGDTVASFMTELRALTEKDRAEFAVLLSRQGYQLKSAA